jgi:hypothetical protein
VATKAEIMMHIILFSILMSLFALFAFAAAGAGEYLVAVPSAIIAAWLFDALRHAAKGRSRGRAR